MTATDSALAHWLSQGQQALEQGNYAAAVTAFAEVRALCPTDVSVALLLANAQRLTGDALATRATLVDAATHGDWRDPATAHALTAALLDAGAPRAALASARHVVAQQPNDPAALGALAAVHRLLGEPETGWPLIERAVRLAPRVPALLVTAAQLRHDLGDLDGADQFYRRALALRPDHAPTRQQQAYSTLMRGASTAGWAQFEHRPLPVPDTNARAWHGEPLDGATILVTAEQGVGDQFQFARFLPLLTARGASRVVVECHRDAVSLFAANGIDAVPRGAPPATDWHVPLLSLPARLGLGSEMHGSRVPYVRAPNPRALPRDAQRLRLGVVWAGNPAFPGGATRDCAPEAVDTLLGMASVQWWALQYGLDPAAARALEARGVVVPPAPPSWADTANLLAGLDGLVTTDTGIAHLAGAMGVRTWVLLQHVPDWRWGLTGETTPWYPSLRLIRPAHWHDWAGVIARLQRELATVSIQPCL